MYMQSARALHVWSKKIHEHGIGVVVLPGPWVIPGPAVVTVVVDMIVEGSTQLCVELTHVHVDGHDTKSRKLEHGCGPDNAMQPVNGSQAHRVANYNNEKQIHAII